MEVREAVEHAGEREPEELHTGLVVPADAVRGERVVDGVVKACVQRSSRFPDPTTPPPTGPAGYSGVLTRNGVSFAIPTTTDIESPPVQQAATACHLGGRGQRG